MMHIPPGLRYLSQIAVSCLPASILTYAILTVLVGRGTSIPGWLVRVSALLSRPAYLIISHFWSEVSKRAEARRRGALVVPQVDDPWPGGLSIIAAMVKNFKTGYPGDIFREWCEQYGNTYALKIIGEARIFTFEPEHIKAILATQFDSYDKGPIFHSQFATLLGTGVFNSDGEMWKFHRTMTRPFFSKERISHFDVFDRHAEDALEQAHNRLAAGYPIDFQDLVSRFTLDAATEFLFGNDVRSLSAGLTYPPPSSSYPSPPPPPTHEHPSTRFVNSFIAGQTLSSLRSRYGPSWALVEFWKDRVRPHRAIVNEFVEPILEEAIRSNHERREREGKGAEKGDEEINGGTLLDHLICKTQSLCLGSCIIAPNHSDAFHLSIDRQVLKDELTNLLVAARDTTASTLTFAMYMLTRHPTIAKRLRAEIARTVGTGRPTYEQIKEMKYMRAFINETLRLYPPVPFDSRTSNKATVWPATATAANPDAKPFYIPAHTKCTYGVFLMHRRTDLWGPDALEFDPDRFLDARVHKYLTPNPFIFLPFNAGPRICLGQQFAYHETSFLLTRLLQRFSRFTLVPPTLPGVGRGWEDEDVRPGVHLTMYVKGGLWVRMESVPLDVDVDVDSEV
ncbi:cytochrome P450 [Lyophyllum atratum]|nr:cytochrome P450 [Lyophyllum atratum]